MDELTAFEVLDILSSAWYGKQIYFLESDGRVFDRLNRELISLDEAVTKFANHIAIDE